MRTYGNIHSIETCGTVDGPGIRFVIFTQGCLLRCQYCHNPDSWTTKENLRLSVEEILEKYEGVREFTKGGITLTGGEPLMQIGFATELFKQAKKSNIHTALDTSGIYFNLIPQEEIDNLLNYTDLVLLDIKHIDDNIHKKLTGHTNKNILEFAKYLSQKNIPTWIRHVVVPNICDDENHLRKLGEFLGRLNNIKALDVLAYHNMAIEKYEKLGIDYPLKDTPQLTKKEALRARDIILDEYKKTKKAKQ